MPCSEKVLKRSKIGAQPLRLNAASRVAHAELHKVLDLFRRQQDLAVFRRVAQRIRQQVVQNRAHCAAIGFDHCQVGIGAHFHPDVLPRSLVAEAVARLIQHLQRPQSLQLQLALAGVQLGHFDQVGHQIVQVLGLFACLCHQFGLQRWSSLR